MALAVPLSRFTPRVGGGSAFFVRPQQLHFMSTNPASDRAKQLESSSIEWLRLEHERLLREIARLETTREEVIRAEKEQFAAISYHMTNTRDYSDSELQSDRDRLARLSSESERYFERILTAMSDSGKVQEVLSRKLR